MALLMFEGWETYGSPFADQVVESGKWASPGTQVFDAGGRTGTQALSMSSASTNTWNMVKTTDMLDGGTVVFGAGIEVRDIGTTPRLFRFSDTSDVVACGLRYTAEGDFELMDAADAMLHSFGPSPVDPTLGFAYIELKVTFDGAAGTAELRVNGATVGSSASGIDTQGSAGTVRRVIVAQGSRITIDDIYILDGTGTDHTDFLGPVRVHALAPNSDVTAEWTPDSGTDNHARVDEMTGGHDGDTSYVASNTVGARDLYGLTDLAAEYQNPVAVQAYWAARHDDSSGGAGMAALLKSGATEVEGDEVALGSGYAVYAEPLLATNPDTGAAWTPAEINALQVGAVVKSNL